nr:MAG TPA: hypothetical protein [Caudoviricetes sp.]
MLNRQNSICLPFSEPLARESWAGLIFGVS